MGALRRTSEVRQVELTDAALHIIATQGIAALSTRSLAQQVGLSSGAIFRHFPSIEAVLEAVVARVEAVLESTLPAATLPPAERLQRFVEGRSTAVGSQLGILRLVVSEQFLLALPAAGSQRLTACVHKTRGFLAVCLRDGQAAGDFRVDVAAETLVPIVMGTVQMLALSPAKTEHPEDVARAVVASLLVLLRPPCPASPTASPTTALPTTPRSP